MKNYLLLLISLFLLSSCEQDPEFVGVDIDKKLPKVDVCHYDAYTDTWKTISINENALQAHLEHGDIEGSCENRKTYVPDEAFEQLFINLGLDDEIDQFVLTAKLEEVTDIFISEWVQQRKDGMTYELYVEDFTGIEDCVNLETFYCYRYGGTDFTLTNKTNLRSVYIRDWESISNIVLENLPNLDNVFIEGTTISELDLSSFPNLIDVFISYCWNLNQLNLRNQNNVSLINFYSKNNDILNCIQVDNSAYSSANWTNVDSWTVFSEDCGY